MGALKKHIMQVTVFTTCYVRSQSAQAAGRVATGLPLPSMGRGIEGEGWSYPEPPPVRFFLYQPHPGSRLNTSEHFGRNFPFPLVFPYRSAIFQIMKIAGLSLIAAVVLIAPSAWCEEASSADTPYASIVARNMFGLVPIPPPDPNAGKPPADPPPKITPTGIMTIFGRDQALFRVANKPRPGQPAKEDAYVLSEGERQDGIEVVKIDHEDAIITFDNHGTVQELPLIPSKDNEGGPGSSGGPRGFGGGAPTMPGVGIPRPGLRLPGGPGMPANFGNNGSNPNMMPRAGFNGGSPNGANALTSLGGNPVNPNANANSANQPESDITPEQQIILMEAQRMQYLQNGNHKLANIIPPTPLTQQNLDENGGGAPPPTP